ncbi:MAG: hypothetical protein D6744_09055 [Planctomycetota bacterium]|nr:MAG: hypothetical protein D6744_09055 [Planctomycetota bacterium]
MRIRPAFSLCVRLTLLAFIPATWGQGFVVNHRHVVLFDEIPTQYLTAAGNLRLLFSDRSVGGNTDAVLDCLTATSWADTPASCRRDYYDSAWNWKTFTEADRLAGLVPAGILYDPDPTLYDRSNWTFEYRAGAWEDLTCDFVQSLAPSYLASKDVLSYQFSYLNVTDTDDIADPAMGFFAASPDRCDIDDVESLIAQNPSKTFVFWTTSLARSIGTDVSTAFNDQMRDYCLANGHILFDFADIESHTLNGTPCYDNRDGVPYTASNGASENHPDDGFDYPAICQDYTTEVDGGHLGAVTAGGIRIAKGMWVLMARIAGWDPFSGDLDDDGDVDAADLATFAACLSGPAQTAPPTVCSEADFVRSDMDEDEDADVSDFARFQQAVSSGG